MESFEALLETPLQGNEALLETPLQEILTKDPMLQDFQNLSLQIPSKVGEWMDQAMQNVVENYSSEKQLFSEIQDQLGLGFDPNADLKQKKSKKTVHSQLNDEQTQLLGEANLAYTFGDLQKAISLYQKLIKACPWFYNAWAQLAMIHDELGDPIKALQTYLVAAHLSKKDVDLWKRIADMSK